MAEPQVPAVTEEHWREILRQLSDLLLLIESTIRVDQPRRLASFKEVMSAAGITPEFLETLPEVEIEMEGDPEAQGGLLYIPVSFSRRPRESVADWFERYACDLIHRLFRHLKRYHPGLEDRLD